MKKQFSILIGSAVAAASLALLSIAANGLVEISPDVGMFQWAREAVLYALLNKLAQKLVASFVLGIGAYLISRVVWNARNSKRSNI